MIEPPVLLDIGAQATAAVHVVIPRAQIREVMGPGIQEVYATLAAQGVAPAGPWLTHHRRMDPQIFDFEISVPVASPIQPTGRVQNLGTPGGRVARTTFHGNYSGLGEAWGQFRAWVEAQGLQCGDHMWETYVLDPSKSPNPDDWRTELTQTIG